MHDPSGRPPAGGVARRRRERRLRARWAPRTTACGHRRQSPAPGRWRSEFRTPAYGHRRLLHRGCGRESCRIPRRRGVLGSTVASAMSLSWLSMSLCCIMVEQPVDASALAFLEEVEANDLEVEYMKLVHAGFHKSPALRERMQEVVRRRHVLRQKGRGRKKKKRRKRRTPRTSSRSSLCRARRRPRRWHAPGWFSSAFLLALCSSLSLAGPRCSASRLFWTRRTVTRFFLTVACARLVLLVLYTSRCVFSLVCRPTMLGVMAGMNLKEFYVVRCSMSLLCGRSDSQVLLWRRPLRSHSCSSLRICPLLLPTAENCGFSAVAVHSGRCLPVATPRLIPMVLATVETPRLPFDMVVNAPILQTVLVPGFQLPCRGAEASPWSRLTRTIEISICS